MDKNNYFEVRRLTNEEKLRQLLDDLPEFAYDYFIGVESFTSALTRMGYAYDLKVFFNFLCSQVKKFNTLTPQTFTIDDLSKVSTMDIERYISYLTAYTVDGKRYSNSIKTKARKLACVRSFFKYFYNHDKLSQDVAAKIPLPKIPEKPIIRLNSDEVDSILTEADNGEHLNNKQKFYHSKTRIRDTAILSLFLGTGIRISELVGINIEDVDMYTNSFKITRKGGNQDILYFNDEVGLALLEYIEQRYVTNPPNEERALFLSLQNKRINVRTVELLVKKYAQIASPLKKITPHKLRSTFGTNLYRETNDIYVVAEVLGHKDINVTKKHYAAISEDIKRDASTKVKLRKNEEGN